MSQCAPTGRTKPRWSRLLTGAAAHTASSPASIAGLPASSAIVWVGPPLFWRPLGASPAAMLFLSPGAVNGQVESSETLCPEEVRKPPEQFPPEAFATMVFVKAREPSVLETPPP